MSGKVDNRLQELGITLPTPVPPLANYVPFVRTGDLVAISGQLPAVDGKVAVTGKVGDGVSIEQGQHAARVCFINVLAQIKAACGGDLDRVVQLVQLRGFIAAPASFTQHPSVMNGASDLAVAVFGEAGRHARAAVGVPSLPADATVEVEALFRIA